MSALAPFVWLLPVGIGVALAARLSRVDGRWNWARAFSVGPAAAAAMLGIWGIARVFDWLAGGGGPLKWVGVTRALATARGPLDSGVLRLGLGAGVLLAIAIVAITRLRRRPPHKTPLAAIGAVIAFACAVVLGGVFASNPVAFAAAMPVDLVAFIAPAALGIALAFIPVRMPAGLTPAMPTPVAPEPRVAGPHLLSSVDAEGVLRRAKLVADKPTFEVAARGTVDDAAGPLDRTWQTFGGAGRAPACVADVLGRLGTDRPGAMLVDLPSATEDAVVGTLLAAGLLEHAARILVICQHPEQLRDRIAAALRELGVERPGPLVAGDGELRDTLAHNTIPALVCADVNDLAGSGLAIRTQRGVSWLRFVQLVVMVEVDRQQPIAASHMAFVLRRLSLALDQQRAHVTWCAIGGSSIGSHRFVEDSTMQKIDRIALGAHASAAVRVFVNAVRGDGDAATVDFEPCARALAPTGLAIQRTGTGDEPDGGFRGDCSLAIVEDRHLVSQFLGRNNIAHRLGARAGHLGLWWVNDTPLSRFLLRDGALVGLEQRGELQTPRPVAGLDNIYLAALHLEAALHDGSADEAALRRAFGDRAVDQLLAAAESPVGAMRSRWNPTDRAIERSQIIAPTGSRVADPRRETVSANTIEVKGSRAGDVLKRVDRRLAPTRFYPHRVFRAGGALYQVGGDAVTDSFVVKPAPAGASPTIPQLSLEVTQVTWIEAPKQIQIGKLSFARGKADIILRETVTGVISRDKGTTLVKYAAITAEYPTRAAVVLFADKSSANALSYAGAMTARLMPAQLLVEPEDVDVVALSGGVGGVNRPALVYVDRHLGGLGVADALDAATIHNLFRWTWGILFRCKCMNGCEQCTPPDILAANPDKVGALKLLGG